MIDEIVGREQATSIVLQWVSINEPNFVFSHLSTKKAVGGWIVVLSIYHRNGSLIDGPHLLKVDENTGAVSVGPGALDLNSG